MQSLQTGTRLGFCDTCRITCSKSTNTCHLAVQLAVMASSRARKKGKCRLALNLEERDQADLLNDPVFMEFAGLEAPFHTEKFGKPNYEARHN